MLKDILKVGDTIYRTGINEMLLSINKQLEVWSIPYQDMQRLEAEQDELYGVLHHMNENHVDFMKWNPRIIPRYKCDKCGKIFYIPAETEECIGEAWGVMQTEWQTCSPCCHRYFYQIDETDEEY